MKASVREQKNNLTVSVDLKCPYCGNHQETQNINVQGDPVTRQCKWKSVERPGHKSCGEWYVLKTTYQIEVDVLAISAIEKPEPK